LIGETLRLIGTVKLGFENKDGKL